MFMQPGFFDVEDRLSEAAQRPGRSVIGVFGCGEFEIFRPTLDETLAYSDRTKGGRPPLGQPVVDQIVRHLVRETVGGLAFTTASAGCFTGPNLCFIFAPDGYDEPEILCS